MCMTPSTPSIEYKDAVRILPEAAMTRIDALLNGEADAPGRDEQLEVYCRMMYEAIRTADGKLLSLNNQLRMNEKLRRMWSGRAMKMRVPK